MSLVKLCACLLNVSEAKNRSLVEQIARAGVVKNFGHKEQNDYIHKYVKESIVIQRGSNFQNEQWKQ